MRFCTNRGRRHVDAPGAAPAWSVCAVAAALMVAVPAPTSAVQILPSFTDISADEQALFHASFAFWESAILDPFEVTLAIGKGPLGEGVLARARDFVSTPDGRPASARIEIADRVADLDWFVDPTPFDSDEYVERQGRLLAGPTSPAWLRVDLATVIHHELAHALGFTVQYPSFAARVVTGPEGQRRYRSATLDVPLAGGGTHLPQAWFPFDLMTDSVGVSERREVSRLDLTLLADAFGYEVVLPPVRPPPVPEPSAAVLCMLALGIAAVRIDRRRNRRRH